MGNDQSTQERLGFDVVKLVQKRNFRLYMGDYAIKGGRSTMEDYHKVLLNFAHGHSAAIPLTNQLEGSNPVTEEYAAYFSMFDGHSGSLCAEYVCGADLFEPSTRCIEHNQNFPDSMPQALKESFRELDQRFLSEEAASAQVAKTFWEADRGTKRGHLEDGCTALVGILWENNLTIANAGDCRAIMVNKDFSVKQLTVDHTPDTPSEKQRIVSKGGKVKKGRINDLAYLEVLEHFHTRILKHSQKVTVEPDIVQMDITPDMRYLVFGTDGVFKRLKNEDIAECIRKFIPSHEDEAFLHDPCSRLFRAAQGIVKEADDRGERDNISVFIIAIHHVEANTGTLPQQKGFLQKMVESIKL